jgi:hypothetical protein
MVRNTNTVTRITEHELFAAKVKLAGLAFLAVIDVVVITVTKLFP